MEERGAGGLPAGLGGWRGRGAVGLGLAPCPAPPALSHWVLKRLPPSWSGYNLGFTISPPWGPVCLCQGPDGHVSPELTVTMATINMQMFANVDSRTVRKPVVFSPNPGPRWVPGPCPLPLASWVRSHTPALEDQSLPGGCGGAVPGGSLASGA